MRLWAQFAEEGHAVSEWKIVAEEYWVETQGSKSPAVLIPALPQSRRWSPTKRRTWLDAAGVTTEVRIVFDLGRYVEQRTGPAGLETKGIFRNA